MGIKEMLKEVTKTEAEKAAERREHHEKLRDAFGPGKGYRMVKVVAAKLGITEEVCAAWVKEACEADLMRSTVDGKAALWILEA